MAVGRTFFFRTAVGRKLLEISVIGTVGRVKSELLNPALTLGLVYGVRVHVWQHIPKMWLYIPNIIE